IEGGCKKGDRVCLLVPKSPAAIVGILGVLKADCIYVPLDPQSPAARQRKIIETCECKWILGSGGVGPLLDEILAIGKFGFPVSIGCLDAEKMTGAAFRAEFSSADFTAYPDGPLEHQNRRE